MKQLPWILVGLLSAALLFSLFFRGCASPQSGQGDTVWLPVRVDTIRDTAVAPPVSERPAGTDTARLPVYRPQEPSGTASIPDSIADTVTVVSDSLSTGTDTARLPVYRPQEPSGTASIPDSIADTVTVVSDSLSTGTDSVDVIIPLTEKEYRTDDYRIVISGYRPQLVSAEFYRRTQTGVVNAPEPKKKRWGIGLSGGYGIGISGKMEPVLAFTITYNLLQW